VTVIYDSGSLVCKSDAGNIAFSTTITAPICIDNVSDTSNDIDEL
jgi:hypothetical protein